MSGEAKEQQNLIIAYRRLPKTTNKKDPNISTIQTSAHHQLGYTSLAVKHYSGQQFPRTV